MTVVGVCAYCEGAVLRRATVGATCPCERVTITEDFIETSQRVGGAKLPPLPPTRRRIEFRGAPGQARGSNDAGT